MLVENRCWDPHVRLDRTRLNLHKAQSGARQTGYTNEHYLFEYEYILVLMYEYSLAVHN